MKNVKALNKGIMLQSSAIDVLAQSSAIVSSTYHAIAELWAKLSMTELWSMMI